VIGPDPPPREHGVTQYGASGYVPLDSMASKQYSKQIKKSKSGQRKTGTGGDMDVASYAKEDNRATIPQLDNWPFDIKN
jgi:hypothetical protein